MPPHVIKQHNRYYAYLSVPKDVRHIFRKATFKKTLNTSDERKAALHAAIVVSRWKLDIAAARDNTDWQGQVLHERDSILETVPPDESDEALEVLFDTASYHFNISKPDELGTLTAIINEGTISNYFQEAYITAFELKYRLTVSPKTCDTSISALRDVAKHFPQTPTDETVEAYIESLYSRYAKNTILRRVSIASKFFQFLIKDCNIPTHGLKDCFANKSINVPRKSKAPPPLPFTSKNLVSIYNKVIEEGDALLADALLICMFTGCRIEELFQLKVDGFLDGTLSIADAKTDAGTRIIPVHKAILPLIESLAITSKDGFLLPTTSNNKYKTRSVATGKRFGRLKTRLNYSKRYNFHSVRRSVVTFLEQAGISEGVTADIVGHEKKTITYGLYSSGSSMEQKVAAIETLVYDGLTI